MRTAFVPGSFVVPQTAVIAGYTLTPITVADVMEDWLVIRENADAIVDQRGGGSRKEWPYTCTLEEDYKDLAWLEVCAAYRQLFCYILRRQSDNSYAGCIYIYPIDLFYAGLSDRYDVDFTCWVTKREDDAGKYDEVFTGLLRWLTDSWPFDRKRIYLRNRRIPPGIAA